MSIFKEKNLEDMLYSKLLTDLWVMELCDIIFFFRF